MPEFISVKEKVLEKKDLTGNAETILFADDEESIRLSAKALLTDYGYNVIDAINGEDAVEKFLQNKDTARLLILDVVMPGKNGLDTYQEIKKICPGIKAIFTSGYTEDSFKMRGMPKEDMEFLLKPVKPYTLLKKIKEVLQEEAGKIF